MEFAYNRVVHKTINRSPFKVAYGFNPITPLDLVHLLDKSSFIHKERVSKVEFIKKLDEKVKKLIEKQTQIYFESATNEERK